MMFEGIKQVKYLLCAASLQKKKEYIGIHLQQPISFQSGFDLSFQTPAVIDVQAPHGFPSDI